LTPADFGLTAMVMVVVGFAQLLNDGGLGSAIIHHRDTRASELSDLYWINVFFGCFLFMLLVAAAPLVATAYGDPRVVDLLRWAALSCVIVSFSQQFQTLLQRELRFEELWRAEIRAQLASLSVGVGAGVTAQGPYSLIWAQLAGTAVNSVLLMRIGLRQWRPEMRFQGAAVARHLQFGAYQLGERSLNFLGRNLDKMLVGALLGAQSLGYYNVSYQLMMRPLQLFNPILTRVLFPLFSRVQDDDVKLRRGFLDTIRIVALVMFPLYAALAVVPDWILITLLGRTWAPAAPLLGVLALLGFFYALGNPLGSLLLAKGRVGLGLGLNVVVLGTYSMAVLIGSRHGAIGVAIALVTTMATVLFPLGFAVRWIVVRLPPSAYIRAFLPALAASMLLGTLLRMCYAWIPYEGKEPLALVVVLPIAALLYAGTIWLLNRRFLQETWRTISL
jgi:O-antigen/teichoic acid export membrane protein